jgi:hypothetical protein
MPTCTQGIFGQNMGEVSVRSNIPDEGYTYEMVVVAVKVRFHHCHPQHTKLQQVATAQQLQWHQLTPLLPSGSPYLRYVVRAGTSSPKSPTPTRRIPRYFPPPNLLTLQPRHRDLRPVRG